MDLDEEKRRFHRLPLTLPVEYTTFHPETGEMFQGQGVLKDFSLSGAYFHSPNGGILQPGHVISLTIATLLAPLHHLDPQHIQVRGEVVRLEVSDLGDGHHGVAVTFLEFPAFFFPVNSLNNIG